MSRAFLPQNCPIIEQTADGTRCGRCWFYLTDSRTCPRHGDVYFEVQIHVNTGKLTLENSMRARKGMSLLGK